MTTPRQTTTGQYLAHYLQQVLDDRIEPVPQADGQPHSAARRRPLGPHLLGRRAVAAGTWPGRDSLYLHRARRPRQAVPERDHHLRGARSPASLGTKALAAGPPLHQRVGHGRQAALDLPARAHNAPGRSTHPLRLPLCHRPARDVPCCCGLRSAACSRSTTSTARNSRSASRCASSWPRSRCLCASRRSGTTATPTTTPATPTTSRSSATPSPTPTPRPGASASTG